MLRWLLAVLVFCCAAAHAAEPELLEPDKAFKFSARAVAPGEIEVRYRIAPGYYMYREKFQFSAEPALVTLDASNLPPGKVRKDEFFGDVQIYRGDVQFVLPAKFAGPAPERFTLKAVSQGCADLGVCYPPHEQTTQVTLAAYSAAATPGSPFFERTPSAAPAPPSGAGQSEEQVIAELFKGEFWLLVASFFGFGLLLAFTPCMLPMFPILSGILAPHGQKLTHARGFALSAAYVLGMAITYAAAGVAAGLLGTMLSAALQNRWVLSAFAAIFVALALAMFGLYELQLPKAFQSKVAVASNHLHRGHFAGVFGMGALSALIVGPCVAAPLAGALLYIGQTGDATIGATALFAMAVGMGVPLLAIGASAGALLPKAGPWMETMKRFFGAILLGVAIYLVSPLLPGPVQLAAWGVLLVICSVFLHAIDPLPPAAAGYMRFFKGLGLIALFMGAAYLVGALSGGRDVLQPLSGLKGTRAGQSNSPAFVRVASLSDLETALRGAAGKPVLLDFYADWCVSCKEMERYTFTDESVQTRLEQMVTLQADVTENRDEHLALLKRFRLFGPPGIVFFNRDGTEIKAVRVIGYQPAEKFAATLDRVLQ